jgi:hypothetical protein
MILSIKYPNSEFQIPNNEFRISNYHFSFKMILIEIALVLFVGWVAMLFAQNFTQLLPFGFKVDDWDVMQTELNTLADTLAPCNGEELRLLSAILQLKTTTHGLFHTDKGTFRTIYNEPMFVFIERRTTFASPNQRATLVKTAQFLIKYKQIGKETTVWVNDELIGIINNSKLLTTDNQLLASIVSADDGSFSIEINRKDTGTVSLKPSTGKHLARAFEIFQPLSGAAEKMRLVLLIREMLDRQVI